MRKNLTKVLALAMAASMMLSACGNSAPAETPSTPANPSAPATSTPATPAAPVVEEKDQITDLVLGKLASAELVTFNVLYTQSASDAEGLCPVWSQALDTNRNGQLIPGLASEWGTEDGGLTWTVKIRDGLKWSDVNGEAVADVDTGAQWYNAANIDEQIAANPNLEQNPSW